MAAGQQVLALCLCQLGHSIRGSVTWQAMVRTPSACTSGISPPLLCQLLGAKPAFLRPHISVSLASALRTFGAGEFLAVGAVLCSVGCLVASLGSAHRIPVAPPLSPSVTTKDSSRHCHLSPGGQEPLGDSHCSTQRRERNHLRARNSFLRLLVEAMAGGPCAQVAAGPARWTESTCSESRSEGGMQRSVGPCLPSAHGLLEEAVMAVILGTQVSSGF